MNHTQNTTHAPPSHYTPSPQMADKLVTNRAGKLTQSQRAPIMIAAVITGIGFVGLSLFGMLLVWGFIKSLEFTGILGVGMLCITSASFLFLIAVFGVNAQMFVPEAFGQKPVLWERGPLAIKMAARERTDMPFSYIVGGYSFAPFVAPAEVPLEKGREYIVYYTVRSRLLMSIAPTDQPESEQWLPTT